MKEQSSKKITTAPIKTAPVQTATPENILFTRENFKWMIIGALIMALGFFLMAGGKSPDPNVFNDKDVYSPIRITIAPILIVAGLLVEIFAIIKKPK
ncbi:MAG: DUF3098 domain-containing protein [Bacteroidota bacterium]|nr:DUF3098 domain-containing protein [Bacteroidota bacterium]